MKPQRRRHPRFTLGTVKLNGQMAYSSEVTIRDISVGGVSLTADQRLNIDGNYSLKLEIDKQVVSVACQVVWAKLSGTKRSKAGEVVPIYTAGLRLVDLQSDSAARFRHLVRALDVGKTAPSRQEADRREHRRFAATPPGIALLDFPADYNVRTLSLSGMLVGCATPVESERSVSMVLHFHDRGNVEFVGRIVRCRASAPGDKDAFHIAIEFVDPSDTVRNALAEFLHSLPATDAADQG